MNDKQIEQMTREVWAAEQQAAADTILRLELVNKQLRDAVAKWPKLQHIDGCAGRMHCKDGCVECSSYAACVCAAGKANVARNEARKLAGLEVET